jgi:hypothetical protein
MAEVFEKWDPYREQFTKRTAFNNNDPFLDANWDGRGPHVRDFAPLRCTLPRKRSARKHCAPAAR